MKAEKSRVRSQLVKAKYVKGEATLEKIREACLEEITLRGYHRTSVCEIVRRANLTRGAFYNYWNSLDDCLADLVLAIRESLQNDPDRIDYEKSLEDKSEMVRRVKANLFIILEKKRRQAYLPIALLQEKGLPGDDLKELLHDYVNRVKEEWHAVIQHDQEQGYILPDLDAEAVAVGIMNSIGGIIHNSELKFRELSQPLENALILFLNACLTESYRREYPLSELLPINFSYKKPVVVK